MLSHGASLFESRVHFPPAAKMTKARVRAWRRSQTRKQILLVPIAPFEFASLSFFFKTAALDVVSCKSGLLCKCPQTTWGEFCQRRRERKINVGFCSLNLSPVRRTSRNTSGRFKGLLWEISRCAWKTSLGSFPVKRPFKLELR